MASKVGLAFLDHSGEIGRIDYFVATPDGAGLAAALAARLPATVGSLAEAICNLSLGTCVVSDMQIASDKFTNTLPASHYAQREIALLIDYQDTVTKKKYRLSVPAPDWENLGQDGSDKVDPAAVKWTDFVTKFEAGAKSPDGNAVTVTGGRIVGRNK